MNDAWHIFFSGFASAATSPAFVLSAMFAIAAAFIAYRAAARTRNPGAPRLAAGRDAAAARAPDVEDLRARVAALESAGADALRNVGFVRFNAFSDVGSELSYALAVVDGHGNGFVVSSIYSREEVRTYAKSVRGFAADKETSNEEREALRIARERAERPR